MFISEIRDGKVVQTSVTDISFDKKVDVLIIGLGSAGSLAAIFAAENGLSVLGAEAYTCIGGTNTVGGISWHYFGCPGGRYIKKDEKVNTLFEKHSRNSMEMRKMIVEQELLEKGVGVLYQASVVGVYMDGKTVLGAKIFTEDGCINVACSVLMDCTGDAVAAHMAGCETEYGRGWDNQAQPYSMVSIMYDGIRYRATNVDFGRVDQRDDKALSDAYIFSRALEMSEERQDMQFVSHMPLIGVREGRRIVAEEMINLENLFADQQTDTPVFYSYADLDKHGWDIAFDGDTLGDWAIGANLGAYNVTVPVSFKTILPKGFDGIMVPCRALGVDRDISSCVRMLPDMKKLAEVAADMAYLAKKHNCKLIDIPYAELSERLLESGCLNHTYNRGCRIDGIRGADGQILPAKDVSFVTSPDALCEILATDTPGEAIWAAKRMGEKAVPTLTKLLTDENENVRKHAAFALAAIGNRESIPALREIVSERDGAMLKDCRKHNNYRGCMAMYWLGRLGDTEILDELIKIIADEKEILLPVYNSEQKTTRYAISAFNGAYFQFASNAVAALVRIGNQNPDMRAKIAKAFEDSFSDDTYYAKITTRPEKSSEGNVAITLKNIAFSAIEKWKEI